ncbi:MAG: CBS domain-containing protein [Patescibacteria group bacterium]|jgi:predicted transcriptional regulator
MKNNQTAATILKQDGVIYAQAENTIGEVSGKFKSSHDAAFIVDENQKLLGSVTPHHLFIKRTYPVSTKLKNCLFHPSKISLDTPLEEVARLMLESKVHYLPVVDDTGTMVGIVTARRLLRTALGFTSSKHSVSEIVAKKAYLETVNETSSLEEAIRYFERSKRMKLVVVNKANHLVGVLPFFDLIPLLMQPKDRKEKSGFYDAKKDNSLFKKYRVTNFMKKETIQVTLTTTFQTVINNILDRSIGSIMVMKDKFSPENIITTSDLLRYFYQG